MAGFIDLVPVDSLETMFSESSQEPSFISTMNDLKAREEYVEYQMNLLHIEQFNLEINKREFAIKQQEFVIDAMALNALKTTLQSERDAIDSARNQFGMDLLQFNREKVSYNHKIMELEAGKLQLQHERDDLLNDRHAFGEEILTANHDINQSQLKIDNAINRIKANLSVTHKRQRYLQNIRRRLGADRLILHRTAKATKSAEKMDELPLDKLPLDKLKQQAIVKVYRLK
ncbi:unnamed protein product [Orchesella dallaii]|uniref:DUF4201 domain-containing protein n=1 Tax=Orchesella dallaii TaxID=48710 RepID=A0ABP1QUX3_9HEXA